jgi:3-hydroxyacyl-[acyl-carrier-protein] dehydratase
MKSNLSLGPDVIQRILPHRRPFLMVDTVEDYDRAPRPTLRAARHISANEPVFEGHFPGLSLWPGVYTIEGLSQAANLLVVIMTCEEAWDARGGRSGDALAALRNMELGYRMQPGFRPELSAELEKALGDGPADGASRIGMSAAVDVKLVAPVFAGQKLDYRVTHTHAMDDLARFEVEASVAGKPVARGVITSLCRMPPIPFARRAR